jgi:hypothetical protein
MLPVLISLLCRTDLSWYLLCCAVLISNMLCCTGLSCACYLCLQISLIFRSLASYRCFLLLFTLPSVLESAASDLCSYVHAGICSSVVYCMLVSVGKYFVVMISLFLCCCIVLYWSLLEADVLVFTGKHWAVLSLLENSACADLCTVLYWSLLVLTMLCCANI